MSHRKLWTAAGLTAATVSGLLVGALIGAPQVSLAQEDSTTTTTAESGNEESTKVCGGFRHFDLVVAATALGITEDELRTALQDGQTIAEVATEQGVDLQTVIDALVADISAEIDQRVADGDLDSDDAATLKESLTDRVTDLVNGELRFGRGLGHRGFGLHHFDLVVAATALGITEDELRTALQDGQTIAEVATEQGVDLQTVIDALVADISAEIDQRVADGDLDSDDAATLKESLTDRVTDLVNGELGFGRGFGHRGFGIGS